MFSRKAGADALDTPGYAATMLHLYDNRESGNCYKIRLLLSFLQTPYTSTDVSVMGDRDRDRGPEFFAKNPIGKIPTLVLEDGRTIGESMAILWHLAQNTKWLPADPWQQLRVMQWMAFEQNNLEPTLATSRHRMAHEGFEPSADLLDAWTSGGNRSLGILESWFQEHDWLVGDVPTIADIACFGYTECCHEGPFDLVAYPAVRAWFDRMREIEGFVPR
jgi:glutathione S-transferase